MWFQFLIGRLKTTLKKGMKLTLSLFQFLIGRLKTPAGVKMPATGTMFQFLIGRLKTGKGGIKTHGGRWVSIPYR